MLQAVPLAATLRIDVDLVVEGAEAERSEVNDLLVELLAAKAGELHIVQTPVQLDMFTGADLFAGLSYFVRSEEVQSYNVMSIFGQTNDIYLLVSLPTSSFLPSLSKWPHMHPCGWPSTLAS